MTAPLVERPDSQAGTVTLCVHSSQRWLALTRGISTGVVERPQFQISISVFARVNPREPVNREVLMNDVRLDQRPQAQGEPTRSESNARPKGPRVWLDMD